MIQSDGRSLSTRRFNGEGGRLDNGRCDDWRYDDSRGRSCGGGYRSLDGDGRESDCRTGNGGNGDSGYNSNGLGGTLEVAAV